MTRLIDAAVEGKDEYFMGGLVFWIGRWHEIKNFLSDVTDVFKIIGGRDCLQYAGWGVQSSHDYLLGGGPQRKLRFFLSRELMVAADMAIRIEARKYFEASRGHAVTVITPEEMRAYTLMQGDVHFSNMMLFFVDFLGAANDIMNGSRNNCMLMAESGRFWDLPWKFFLHRTNFGPELIREISILWYRCNPKLRLRKMLIESLRFPGSGSLVSVDEMTATTNTSVTLLLQAMLNRCIYTTLLSLCVDRTR